MAIKDSTDWRAFEVETTGLMSAEYKRKAVKHLMVIGESVVKYARDDKSLARHYTDRTGNLRSSIGYVVVQDGMIAFSSFDGNTEKGKAAGRNYAIEVAQSLSPNKTYLVWVAGMEYASYVEAKGFDVISGSGNWLESNIVKEREKFKRYLLSNRE